MPGFLRAVLIWGLLLGGLYWYAETRGLFIGWPPFTPVLLWNYTGERAYDIYLRGDTDSVKVRVEGHLRRGRLWVAVARKDGRVVKEKEFSNTFREEFKQKLPPGAYLVRFSFEEATGWAKLDWVSTKFSGW